MDDDASVKVKVTTEVSGKFETSTYHYALDIRYDYGFRSLTLDTEGDGRIVIEDVIAFTVRDGRNGTEE